MKLCSNLVCLEVILSGFRVFLCAFTWRSRWLLSDFLRHYRHFSHIWTIFGLFWAYPRPFREQKKGNNSGLKLGHFGVIFVPFLGSLGPFLGSLTGSAPFRIILGLFSCRFDFFGAVFLDHFWVFLWSFCGCLVIFRTFNEKLSKMMYAKAKYANFCKFRHKKCKKKMQKQALFRR